MAVTVRRREDLKWIAIYCSMIEVSLLAYLLNGAFVNMEYFDLIYHWVSVVVSLKLICRSALSEREIQDIRLPDNSMAVAET